MPVTSLAWKVNKNDLTEENQASEAAGEEIEDSATTACGDCRPATSGMALIRQEGPIHREKKVEDEEEILPDGTVHHIHKERTSSVKNVKKCVATEDGQVKVVEETKEEVPGTFREDLVETFEEPAHTVHEEQDFDVVLPGGKKVHKHVVINRMEHHVHTHQESFDSESGRKASEDFDMDEVVPGTQSVWVTQDDDDDDDSCSSSGGSGNFNKLKTDKAGHQD